MKHAPRRGTIPGWVVAASVTAALVAAAPVGLGLLRGSAAPGTAFASAPAGDYAVVANSQETVDVIRAVRAGDAGPGVEIGRVDHLPGYYANGAVSPDGRSLALIAADAGTPAKPGVSLLLLDLGSGRLTRLATGVDLLQGPVWTADSGAIVVTRSEGDAGSAVDVLLVPVDLAPPLRLDRLSAVLGVYPVGFDPGGRLVSVVLDGRGSTVRRDSTDVASLSAFVTRDWRLSPDGTQIAFIEANLESGLRYLARVADLNATAMGGGVAAQGLATAGQQLGAAWKPGGPSPSFGAEPPAGAVRAQGYAEAGFDLPLAYSPAGEVLAVQHWTGASFAEPGQLELQLVAGELRQPLPEATRFYGWARR